MIVLEKWKPNKPISVVYLDGERERYYVKRFMIEHPDREEKFISEHTGSKLMIVAMDFRPMAEVIYSKRSLENEILNFEDFISVKENTVESAGDKPELPKQEMPQQPKPEESGAGDEYPTGKLGEGSGIKDPEE